MSARDELTTLILGKTAPRAADAILAAGYTKSPTIQLFASAPSEYELYKALAADKAES
jgi:hypothetical protein